MPNIPPLITHRPNDTALFATVAQAGQVDSVVAGTNISVDSTNPKAPIVSCSLVAGCGLFSASFTSAQVDLAPIAASNVMTIPVPAPLQTAKIFKVHLSGTFTYSSAAGPNVTMKAYCAKASALTAPAAGDTLVNVDMNSVSNFRIGQSMMETLTAIPFSWIANEYVFLVQNSAAAAVPNLYFTMVANPNDGSQGIGVLDNVNLNAVVEAYL